MMIRLLRQEPATVHGERFQLIGTRSGSAPTQRPHPPIGIGSSGEKRTPRITTRHAQPWTSTLSPSSSSAARMTCSVGSAPTRDGTYQRRADAGQNPLTPCRRGTGPIDTAQTPDRTHQHRADPGRDPSTPCRYVTGPINTVPMRNGTHRRRASSGREPSNSRTSCQVHHDGDSAAAARAFAEAGADLMIVHLRTRTTRWRQPCRGACPATSPSPQAHPTWRDRT